MDDKKLKSTIELLAALRGMRGTVKTQMFEDDFCGLETIKTVRLCGDFSAARELCFNLFKENLTFTPEFAKEWYIATVCSFQFIEAYSVVESFFCNAPNRFRQLVFQHIANGLNHDLFSDDPFIFLASGIGFLRSREESAAFFPVWDSLEWISSSPNFNEISLEDYLLKISEFPDYDFSKAKNKIHQEVSASFLLNWKPVTSTVPASPLMRLCVETLFYKNFPNIPREIKYGYKKSKNKDVEVVLKLRNAKAYKEAVLLCEAIVLKTGCFSSNLCDLLCNVLICAGKYEEAIIAIRFLLIQMPEDGYYNAVKHVKADRYDSMHSYYPVFSLFGTLLFLEEMVRRGDCLDGFSARQMLRNRFYEHIGTEDDD